MFRKIFVSMITLGALSTAVAMPASAQPLWGSVNAGFRIGQTPVQLSVATAPAPVVYEQPTQTYSDVQSDYVIPANQPTGVEAAPVDGAYTEPVYAQPVYAPTVYAAPVYIAPVYVYPHREVRHFEVRRELHRERDHR